PATGNHRGRQGRPAPVLVGTLKGQQVGKRAFAQDARQQRQGEYEVPAGPEGGGDDMQNQNVFVHGTSLLVDARWGQSAATGCSAGSRRREKSFSENTSVRIACSMKLRSPALAGIRTVRWISPATGTWMVTRGSTDGIIRPRWLPILLM